MRCGLRVMANRAECRVVWTARGEPVEIDLNNAAQIIFALLIGAAAVLRALTGFLPVWRARRDGSVQYLTQRREGAKKLDPGSSPG